MYVSPSIIESLYANPDSLSLRGERREVTFLFTDIAGFVSLVESITDPEILVATLNEYLELTCNVILEYEGTIDKIIGDALHVMFNAPSDQNDHAQRAVQCALALDRVCEKFRRNQNNKGVALGETRIGINTGTVIVGNFGGSSRFDYTAHGNAINTAARLESAGKYLSSRILVSEITKNKCHAVHFREIGDIQLKGKSSSIAVYQAIQNDGLEFKTLGQYQSAYLQMKQSSVQATELFNTILAINPDDRLVAFQIKRLQMGDNRDPIKLDEK